MPRSKQVAPEEKAVDTAAISSQDPEVLSEQVDTAARKNHVMGNVIATTHDRTGEAGSKFKVRERGSLNVQQQDENTEISTEDLSYDNTEIGVDKYGESVILTTEAKEDGMGVDNQDAVEELGEAFADEQDNTAYNTLTGNASVGTTQLETAGEFTAEEFIQARAEVRDRKYEADSIVVSPLMEAEMLKIDDFVHADKYGNDGNVDTGEIGRVYGMTVYVSTTANDPDTTGGSGTVQAVFVDSDQCLDRVVKREITVEVDNEKRKDRDVIVGTSRWGHGVVNPGAAHFLVS